MIALRLRSIVDGRTTLTREAVLDHLRDLRFFFQRTICVRREGESFREKDLQRSGGSVR